MKSFNFIDDIDKLVDNLRKHSLVLHIVSTIDTAKTKYSVLIRDCNSPHPQCWDDYLHANTLIEAIHLATNKYLTENNMILCEYCHNLVKTNN